jgi:hypothetical protein
MPKHHTLEIYEQITQLSGQFAQMLGDDPVAIANAVSAELSRNAPQSPEERRAIEELLQQSQHLQRPRQLM